MDRHTAAFVKGTHEAETPEVLLRSPTSVLLGVDRDAERLLGSLGISTVFDLASAHLFGSAHALARETLGVSSVYDRLGRIPGDVIDPGELTANPDDVARASIDVLRPIGPHNRDAFATALGVTTVRDLGWWPPYHAARRILNLVYGGGTEDGVDPDAPEELVPVARRYATETVRFRRIFFDRIERGDGLELRDLGTASPLAVDQLALERGRAWAPATGALLVFEQTWKPQGLSLGQLLSSVGLAPGESTKIAVIDWSRRVATAATEDIAEQDRIQAEVAQSRAITEIQNITARENVRGRSTQTTDTTTDSAGWSSGGGIRGLFSGGSESGGWADTWGETTTVASSRGKRSVSADTFQDIQGSTRQASTAVRSRRASLVTETRTTEKEEIRTRILVNYNHSHALTIQYYEVVQIYRTEVRLQDWQRVLFVPIRIIDFKDPKIIARFRYALLNAISDNAVRASISGFVNDVVLREHRPAGAQAAHHEVDGAFVIDRIAAKTSAMVSDEVTITLVRRDGSTVEVESTRWSPLRPGEQVVLSDLQQIKLTYRNYRGDLAQNADIAMLVTPADTAVGGRWLKFKAGLDGSGSLPEAPSHLTVVVVTVDQEPIDPGALDWLQENAVELSHAVWASLTQQELATILGSYQFRGDPLLEVVDVKPLTFFGNYMVLPYHPQVDGVDHDWESWKGQHIDESINRVEEDLIPVPTDGLFAEAVLGRFNASEKIDLTRFWDWQESPIPMQAPDIGTIVAGNHVAGAGQLPGQLGPSLIGLQTAPALPAPTGLGPLIAAASGDLFRDMSGLEETAATLRESIAQNTDAAENAAKLATEIEAIKQKTIGKLAEMATQAALAAATGGTSGIAAAAGQAAGIAGGNGAATSIGQGRQHMPHGPGSSMSNSTRGGLLNENLKIDESLLQQPGSTWAAPGAPGSNYGTTMDSIRGYHPTEGAPVPTGRPPEPEPPMRAPTGPTPEEQARQRELEANAGFGFIHDMPDGQLLYVLINFDVGGSELEDGHRQILTDLTSRFTMDRTMGINWVGAYASTTGAESANFRLAQSRATAVLDHLGTMGIGLTQLAGYELDAYYLDIAGESQSLAALIEQHGIADVPDDLPQENPFDRGVALLVGPRSELQVVNVTEPFWKQPTADWRIRFLFPDKNQGPVKSIPTKLKDLAKIMAVGTKGKIDFEATAIHDVNGTPTRGATVKGAVMGKLILHQSDGPLVKEHWTLPQEIDLHLDGAPLRADAEDWRRAQVAMFGFDLRSLIDLGNMLEDGIPMPIPVGPGDALEYASEWLMDEVLQRIGTDQKLLFTFRIVRNMSSFTPWFSFEDASQIGGFTLVAHATPGELPQIGPLLRRVLPDKYLPYAEVVIEDVVPPGGP